jgi:hypothetical protein
MVKIELLLVLVLLVLLVLVLLVLLLVFRVSTHPPLACSQPVASTATAMPLHLVSHSVLRTAHPRDIAIVHARCLLLAPLGSERHNSDVPWVYRCLLQHLVSGI